MLKFLKMTRNSGNKQKEWLSFWLKPICYFLFATSFDIFGLSSYENYRN